MIQLLCPNCTTTLEIDDGLAGQEIRCGACAAVAIAPARAWLAPKTKIPTNQLARSPAQDARPPPDWI
jgi:predicted Zn finger-like uncharacterized protein